MLRSKRKKILDRFSRSGTASPIAPSFKTRVLADGGVIESEQCLTDRIQHLENIGLWQKASAVWLPHGYKEGKLYAVKGGAGADFTFSRAGIRYRKDSNGFIRETPHNLITNSRAFDQWSKLRCSVVANATVGPDEASLADLVQVTDDTDLVRLSATTYSTNLGARQYTVIVYVKQNNLSGTFNVSAQFTSGNFLSTYTITDGVIAHSGGGGFNGATLDDVDVTDVGNGWYKIKVVATAAGLGGISLFVDLVNSSNGEGIFLDKAQVYIGDTDEELYLNTSNRFNIPAIDYRLDSCPSLSLEPAKTNRITRSTDISQTEWSKSSTTFLGRVAAPDGSNTASRLRATSADAWFQHAFNSAGVITTVTVSVWLRAENPFTLRVGLNNPATSANFNVTADWQRFSLTYTANAAATPTITFGGASTFANNQEVDVWMVQYEEGLMTSEIPTNSGTVSRITDSVTALTDVSDLIGQTEGTIYFEGYAPADGTSKNISLSDGTDQNRIILQFLNTNVIRAFIGAGGVSQAQIANAGFTSDTLYRVAVIYKSNYCALIVNGVKEGEDTSVTVPACSRIGLDVGTGSLPFFGNINTLAILPVALEDSEAVALTTIS